MLVLMNFVKTFFIAGKKRKDVVCEWKFSES